MKFNKKAAMEIGISTVVMLVIAIVVIGGGIAFIRNFFDAGEDSLIGAFDVADFGIEPSSQNPLVLVDGTISLRRGSEAPVRVGFYNKDTSGYNVDIEFGECVTSATNLQCEEDELRPQIVSLPQRVDPGSDAGFIAQVAAECVASDDPDSLNNMNPGTYTCNILAVNTDSEDGDEDRELARTQIMLEVTS